MHSGIHVRVLDRFDHRVVLVISATVATVIGVMPGFLVGASAVLVRAELGISEAALGLAIAAFFAASALSSVAGGRLAEVIGPLSCFRLVSVITAAVLVTIAVYVRNISSLVAALAVGGVANGVGQPASNLAISYLGHAKQSMAFGVKQASIPLATLLAGASVPLVGVRLGWRYTFMIAAALTWMGPALWPRTVVSREPTSRRVRKGRHGDAGLPPLIALAVAGGVGTAAATSLGAFLVETGVAEGLSVGTSGWLLVVGSCGGIASRVSVGWVVGRQALPALRVTSGMLLVGSLGFALLATGGLALLVIGTILAFTCAWGWTGLLIYAVVRFNPNAPAAATGIVNVGSGAGAAAGPLLLGLLVTRASFNVAWTVAGVGAALAGGLVLVARQWLHSDRDGRAAASVADGVAEDVSQQ